MWLFCYNTIIQIESCFDNKLFSYIIFSSHDYRPCGLFAISCRLSLNIVFHISSLAFQHFHLILWNYWTKSNEIWLELTTFQKYNPGFYPRWLPSILRFSVKFVILLIYQIWHISLKRFCEMWKPNLA